MLMHKLSRSRSLTYAVSGIVSTTILSIWAHQSHADGYVELGRFFANAQGSTSLHLRLPSNSGEYRDYLSWGYPIWETSVDPVGAPGWLLSEDLSRPPYNVPEDATAVRLHIVARVVGATWAESELIGSLRVSARPNGGNQEPNEILSSVAYKPEGYPEVTPYDINHLQIDVLIGENRKIELFQNASIVGDYVQIDLMPYIAGYWLPLSSREENYDTNAQHDANFDAMTHEDLPILFAGQDRIDNLLEPTIIFGRDNFNAKTVPTEELMLTYPEAAIQLETGELFIANALGFTVNRVHNDEASVFLTDHENSNERPNIYVDIIESSDGTLKIVDAANSQILQVDLNGNVLEIIDGPSYTCKGEDFECFIFISSIDERDGQLLSPV